MALSGPLMAVPLPESTANDAQMWLRRVALARRARIIRGLGGRYNADASPSLGNLYPLRRDADDEGIADKERLGYNGEKTKDQTVGYVYTGGCGSVLNGFGEIRVTLFTNLIVYTL